jgi:hypothetical protein
MQTRPSDPNVSWYLLEEAEVELDEGPLHHGKAVVVSGVGRRSG